MTILYDIALLGSGFYTNQSRTGVFRVVENIAEGLTHAKKIDLLFCASHGNTQELQYVRGYSQRKNVPFVYPNKIEEFIRNSHLNLKKKEKALFTISGKPGSGLIVNKLKRKAYNVIRKRIFSQLEINHRILTQADIYHSPYVPLPVSVQSYKNIKKFLTVYDLIPILFPQFFQFEKNHLVEQAIQSLSNTGWAFCISQSTKDDLCNYLKIDPERVFVTHLAASPEIFYPCTDLALIRAVKRKYAIPDAPYFLSLCTLEPRKNIDQVIQCFMKLIQEEHIKDIYLVLVGTKGWDFDKIFNQITTNSFIKSRIIVTGYVKDEELAALYSGALCFLYTSFYEGFGLPPLEAMQCGVPVITSNTSSLPEVVGDAGIMVKPTDADALCQSMLHIYKDSLFCEELSQKSIVQAGKFSWEKCVQKTIKGYSTAITS